MAEVHVNPLESGKFGTYAGNGDSIIRVGDIEKAFGSKGSITHALNGVSFEASRGEFVGIMGPSGSGKTTLLNCISTVDRPTRGFIEINGKELTRMDNKALSRFRRDELGFIFQDSNLLSTLTGFENIALALTIKRVPSTEITNRVEDVAASLDVWQSLDKYPHQMSGGQRQRIAAARAIVGDPSLILADEPTGALDSRNATLMLDALTLMNRQMGATILMVTHDAYAASFTQRVLFIKDGCIFSEIRRGSMDRGEYFNRIMEVVSFLGGDVGHAV